MAATNQLTSKERNFFSLINQVIFTNPFSFDRIAIDMKIGSLFPGVAREKIPRKTIVEARKRIDAFEKSGAMDTRRFDRSDGKLVRNSFLFNFYHLYRTKFDHLITEQIKAGAKPIKAAFAKDAFSYLETRGFSPDDTRYYFSLCYQLRRAVYFISRNLAGDSPCMESFRESIWNNIFTYNLDLYNQHVWNRMEDFPTLLLGETGTGKAIAAGVVGRSGYIPFDTNKQCFTESFTQTVQSLNLSEGSPSHVESSLFGHVKGSVADAASDHDGLFAHVSENGTVFLDEIESAPPSIQIKLRNVLEKRSFAPIGSRETHRFDGRIIAASRCTLDEIIHGEKARRDFFHCLCSDIIHVPSLRARMKQDPSELAVLVMAALKRILGHFSSDLHLMICNTIKRDVGVEYDWPGNLRELNQCIRRILLSKSYTPPRKPPLPKPPSTLTRDMDEGVLDIPGLIQGYCKMLYQKHGSTDEVARITKLNRRTVKKHLGE